MLTALARVAKEGSLYNYQIATMALSIGGVPLCRALFRARLVTRALGLLGIGGYAIFLLEAVLQVLDLDLGLTLLIPGAVFEIALGLLLLVRGSAAPHPSPEAAVPATA